MQLYYLEDLSLGEIAEEYDVSRQAVYDNVRRTEAMLEDYEVKLNLFSKFQERIEIVEQSGTTHNGIRMSNRKLFRELLDYIKRS